MKKIILLIIILLLLGGATAAGVFYWKNLRGVGPVIKPAPGDITKLLEQKDAPKGPLSLPTGFSISVWAKNLEDARVLTRDPDGNMLVSLTSAGKIVALKEQKSGEPVAVTVAEGLNKPHGVLVHCYNQSLDEKSPNQKCSLLVAATDGVYIGSYDRQNLKSNLSKFIDLPSDGRHFTRTILFVLDQPKKDVPTGSSGKLYVATGSSCDVCHETDSHRASIWVADLDLLRGPKLEQMVLSFKPFSIGLRNSVFMTVNPATGKIWATEMGRDMLGDNIPPDEINIIEEGKNYGWPICYGQNIHDTSFDKNTYIKNPCAVPQQTPSLIDIPAHSAPLGLVFASGKNWPADYQNNLFVAYHGSWNRSTPTGYKVVRYKLDDAGKVLSVEDFITGWLNKNGALGRPVAILAEDNGTMYISDDKAGVIYKVSYNAEQVSTSSNKTSYDGCKITGCGGQICSDKEMITTCEYAPEYACYTLGRCGKLPDGHCGWTETDLSKACLADLSKNIQK